MIEQVYLPQAIKMARQGATRGMIIAKLRGMQIRGDSAEHIADAAMRVMSQRKRFVGFLQFSGGALIMLAAIALFVLRLHRMATGVSLAGFIIAGIGLANLLHRRH